MMLKNLTVAVVAIFFIFPAAQAQGILPQSNKPDVNCNIVVKDETYRDAYRSLEGLKRILSNRTDDSLRKTELNHILSCAIKSGRVRLYMMPFFITYLIQFLLGIAGIIAVLFVVIGGYKYTVGGLIEEKEQGKKYIINALLGLVVALSGWMIVNLVQIALTR